MIRRFSPGLVERRICATVVACVLAFLCKAVGASAQSQPVAVVQEECAAPAFAPDGRLAYAVRRIIRQREYEIQRDDIWILTPGSKPKRVVDGEKLIRSPFPFRQVQPYSYAIQSLRWSPDGERLTAELLTTQVLDINGTTREGQLVLLIDQTGREIKIKGGDSVIEEASNASWLADGATVAFLNEAVKPKLLYSMETARPVSGRGDIPFPDGTYSAVAWDAARNAAAAIERDKEMRNPPHLVWLDLVKHTRRDLGLAQNFSGGLTVSPSGSKVGYFRGADTFEIRDIADPEKTASVRVSSGPYFWGRDEQKIIIKRGDLRKSTSLVWVPIPVPAKPPAANSPSAEYEPAISSLTVRDFALSQDGKWLAVVAPGTRYISIYAVP
ncbi:MAG: hypothetical protein HY046_08955 [Acidobacteria bacterium]|nr:hypothetical protein [Acidobacteriota bacterium]